jgi:hypothetical protein
MSIQDTVEAKTKKQREAKNAYSAEYYHTHIQTIAGFAEKKRIQALARYYRKKELKFIETGIPPRKSGRPISLKIITPATKTEPTEPNEDLVAEPIV